MVIKFDDIKQEIITKLQERNPNLKCPLCEKGEMVLADGFISHPINKELSGSLIIGGPTVPTIAVICKNCSYMMQFSIGALGLLPRQQGDTSESGGTL